MKLVQQKRRVWDSRHTDGALWRAHVRVPVEEEEDVEMEDVEGPTFSGTAESSFSASLSGPRAKKKFTPASTTVDERAEGWLWQLGKLSKMIDTEMEEWSSEALAGDRVQWFRAEAEMQRWQEQGEQKLTELLRTIRSFRRMQQTWTVLGSTNLQPGPRAYARKKAAMYERRATQAQDFVIAVGYPDLLAQDANPIQRVQLDRVKEAKLVSDAVFGTDVANKDIMTGLMMEVGEGD
ncbi:hypothetical protein B0H13DRAFT_2398328 [Mycena leptocephala]|nr:hypothetical protein B0H13DRAFT_2398328 [Mycena leptocephala]